MRLALGMGLLLLITAVLAAGAASAKGGYSLVSARLFGGRLLDQAIVVPVSLPDGYDELYERDDPPGANKPTPSIYQSNGYHVSLTYDFSSSGYGTQERLGWYDGDTTLWFTQDMVVGPGTWKAGWYTASPLLAKAIQSALHPDAPTTGLAERGARAGLLDPAVVLFAAGASFAALAASPWRKRTR